MTLQNKPLLNANLRWFLVGMILANIAGQMTYSFLVVACLISISIAWAKFSLPQKEPDIAFEG